MHKFLLHLVVIAAATATLAQDRTTARSMVISPYGIVATSQVQASQAGAEILARGGSAVDAAIAANATLGVIEPNMNGIGGDLFAIYWDARSGKLYGLNASGWAPKALTIDSLKAKGVSEMPPTGIDAVTVPGAVEGWTSCTGVSGICPGARFLRPAIFYAENGFPVPGVDGRGLEAERQEAKARSRIRCVFLVRRPSPPMARSFNNPDSPKRSPSRRMAEPRAFYPGDIAKAILATERELNGAMSAGRLERNFPPNGWSPSPPRIAAGRSTSSRPTARAWPRSKC